jgi:signal peptidase I
MNDGSGAPPWGPADPVPELADTQAIPGLGSVPGLGESPGQAGGSQDYRRPDGPGDPSAGAASNGTAWNGTAWNGTEAGGNAADGVPPANGNGSGSGDSRDSGKRSGGSRRGRGRRGRPRSFWRELPVLVIVALVLAFVIKSFAFQAFFIPSGSMQNTLEIGDRILINKIVYHLRPIHRGDIIVFDGHSSWDFDTPQQSGNLFTKAIDELKGLVGASQDSSIYIKRVIGLPGDRVACCNTKDQVTVNGVPLSEGSYLYPGNEPSMQKFSVTVPAGNLWVMGDHRMVSYDSRGHMGDPGGGSIPESAVLGRAFVIIWPPSRWGFLNIPATFEQPQLNAATASGGNAAAGGSSAALEAALDNGTPLRSATSALPLALGFVGAVPVTWLQRKARRRLKSRRTKRTRPSR